MEWSCFDGKFLWFGFLGLSFLITEESSKFYEIMVFALFRFILFHRACLCGFIFFRIGNAFFAAS